MDIHEYRIRQREMAPRGSALPWAKLDESKVREAREIHERAQAARKHIDEHYSAAGLARRYGVSVRTMERVLCRETWGHVR